MKEWWVYKYCPETFYEDMFRFWQKDLMIYELKKCNFVNISAKREYYEKNKPTIFRPAMLQNEMV